MFENKNKPLWLSILFDQFIEIFEFEYLEIYPSVQSESELKSLKNCVKQKIEFNIRIEIYVTIIVNALENGNRINKA